MSAIFFRFIEIALFRKGPQDLPASGFLLGLTLACNVAVVSLSVFLFQRSDLARGALQSILGLGSEILLVWAILQAFNHSERLLQTLTAVLGVDTVISLAFIPLLVSMPITPGAGQASAVQWLLLIGLLSWGVVALGGILRHAVNVSLFAGIMISLSYHIAVYSLVTVVV